MLNSLMRLVLVIALALSAMLLPDIALALSDPYSQDEYLMTHMGINYQWLFFNMISNSTQTLYYVAMAFALIGGVVILILPKFQKAMVIIPYMFIMFIVLIGPYDSDIFFDDVTINNSERVAPGDYNTMFKYRGCNAGATCEASTLGGLPRAVDITGQSDALNKPATTGLNEVKGYTPQIAIINFTNKIQSALVDTLFSNMPKSVADVQSESAVMDSSQLSVDDLAIQYEIGMFNKVCYSKSSSTSLSKFQDRVALEQSGSKEVLNRRWNLAWDSFTLRDAKKLNDYFYLKNTGAFTERKVLLFPVRAEGLVGYIRGITPQEYGSTDMDPTNPSKLKKIADLENFWNSYVKGTDTNIGKEMFLGRPTHNQSPLLGDKSNLLTTGKSYGYFFHDSNSVGQTLSSYVGQAAALWLSAHMEILREGKKAFPRVLYREPEFSTLGSALGSAKTTSYGDISANWSSYTNVPTNQAAFNAELKGFPKESAVWHLPVALRIPQNTGVGNPYGMKAGPAYDSTNQYSYRVTNCAEFHRALQDRYIDKVENDKEMLIALTDSSTKSAVSSNGAGNGSNMKINASSNFADIQGDLSNIADAYIRSYRTKNGGAMPSDDMVREYLRGYVLTDNSSENMMTRIGKSGAFSGLSTTVASVGESIGGWAMEIISWFIGVAAQLFYVFARALAFYGLAISLMVTPVIYMMGLIIPGWSMQIILAPIAAVLYFKTVSISFLLIEFFISALRISESIYAGGTIEHALYTFIAAAAYMGAFGFAGFLLFGLGSAGGMVQQLGGKMDAAAAQGAGQLSRTVSTPLKTAAAGAGMVVAGKASATVTGTIASKRDGEGRKWFNQGGAPLDKDGNPLASAFQVGQKEGGDVWHALGDSIKRIPVVGGLASESFNAGRQAKSTGQMMDSINKSAHLKGEEPLNYDQVRKKIDDRGYAKQSIQHLYAAGEQDAATELAFKNLDMFSPSEQNDIMRRKMKVSGQSSGTIPITGKNADGESVFIDSFMDTIESGSFVKNYAEKHGLDTSDAKKQIFGIVNDSLYQANEDNDKYFSAFSTKNEDGNIEGGFKISKEMRNNNEEGYNKVTQMLEDGIGAKGFNNRYSSTSGDDVFINDTFEPPSKGEGTAQGQNHGVDPTTPGSGGPTRVDTSTAEQNNTDANTHTNSRDNTIVPQNTDLDGEQLGRDIAKGMKDEMNSSVSQFGNQYNKEGMFYMTSKQKKSVDEKNKAKPEDDES